MQRLRPRFTGLMGAAALIVATGFVGLVTMAGPAAAQTTPTITVTPHSGLSNNQSVRVTGSNFTPGETQAAVVECAGSTLVPDNCSFTIPGSLLTVASDGTFDMTLTVSDGDIGDAGASCPCSVVGADISDLGSVGGDFSQLPHASVALSFGRHAQAPGAPSGLSATGGDDEVALSWTAPENDGGTAITGYTVYRSTTAGTQGDSITSGITDTRYSDAAVTNGTTYYYEVTASNDIGESSPSEQIAVKPSAGCTAAPYDDVATGSAFCADISWLEGQHITHGYPDGDFHPTAPVTRQAMAAFLYRAHHSGQTAPACGSQPFDDVPTTNRFCGAITWLEGQHITHGYPDGDFHPTAPVTRQAMAAFLYRLQG